jgi:hypothetical protein
LGCFHPHEEHVWVEFLSEISVYVAPALSALKRNMFLNIPIPESREIPDIVFERFISLHGTSPMTNVSVRATSFVDSLWR